MENGLMRNKIINTIIHGDALKVLKDIPDNSIDCCVTSPPYWSLRDYEDEKQIGIEKTFEEYILNLCNIFDEVKRVLKESGTCWVNIGDCYSQSGKAGNPKSDYAKRHTTFGKNCKKELHGIPTHVKNLPPKTLIQIPSRFAIEMSNRGWILRNELIWHKPNCMPSSAKDRFTIDFEKLFFFTKNKKYWFKQQMEPTITRDTHIRNRDKGKLNNTPGRSRMSGLKTNNYEFKNKRSTWAISTKSFKGAHFAVYPEKLIETPIDAGCPKGGIILDPFIGSGTTAVVAKKQNKNYIGIETNREYIKIANERIKNAMQ